VKLVSRELGEINFNALLSPRQGRQALVQHGRCRRILMQPSRASRNRHHWREQRPAIGSKRRMVQGACFGSAQADPAGAVDRSELLRYDCGRQRRRRAVPGSLRSAGSPLRFERCYSGYALCDEGVTFIRRHRRRRTARATRRRR
jgi:hypothetical protein